MPRRGMLALGILATLGLAGCAAPTTAEPVVMAVAASLEPAMTELIDAYRAEHPDAAFAPLEVAGSQQLVQQVNHGAPVDVLALADEQSLDALDPAVREGAQFAVIAENTLVVITPESNPAGVTALADLANPATAVVVCAPAVPCGRATAELLHNAAVTIHPASEEANVTAVLTKVVLGEADAGVVYRTDALRSDAVRWFAPDGAEQVVNRYPIAALGAAPQAAEFVEFVRGERGRAILAAHGFEAPDG